MARILDTIRTRGLAGITSQDVAQLYVNGVILSGLAVTAAVVGADGLNVSTGALALILIIPAIAVGVLVLR